MAAVLRRVLVLLVICTVLAVVGFGGVARAHGGSIAALVTFEPKVPGPGVEATVTVRMLDTFSNQIPGVKVRIALGAVENELPAPLQLAEATPGVYTGKLKFPPAGMALLDLQSDLPDGTWQTQFPLRVGPGALEMSGLMLQLLHADALAATPVDQPAVAPPPPKGGFRFSYVLIGAGLLIILYGIYVARQSAGPRYRQRQRVAATIPRQGGAARQSAAANQEAAERPQD